MQSGEGKFENWWIGPGTDDEGTTEIGKVLTDSEGGFPNGGNAAKFVYVGPGTYQVVAAAGQGADLTTTFPMQPGQKYRFTVHVKATGEPVVVMIELRPRTEGATERTRTLGLETSPEWKSEWQEKAV